MQSAFRQKTSTTLRRRGLQRANTWKNASCCCPRQRRLGYSPVGASEDICSDVCSRLRLVRSEEARVKLHLGKLGDILNPQPRVAAVVHTLLLHWIYSAGEASQRQAETPPLPRPDGTPIFPPYEKYWWLTDLEHRKPAEILANPEHDLIDDESFRAVADHAGCGSSLS